MNNYEKMWIYILVGNIIGVYLGIKYLIGV
jgi:hypothetical protein